MCRVTMGHLRVTVGHPRVTIGHLRATMGHLRLTIGYLKVTAQCLTDYMISIISECDGFLKFYLYLYF